MCINSKKKTNKQWKDFSFHSQPRVKFVWTAESVRVLAFLIGCQRWKANKSLSIRVVKSDLLT